MMIHVERRLTVAEFLAAMRREHGDLESFRKFVRRHPRDVAALLDLEAFAFYVDRPDLASEMIERAVSLIPVGKDALAMFTGQRLALLDALANGTFESVRQLATHIARDVHNVHADLELFRKLGIVTFEFGPGRRRIPRLEVDSIRLVVGPSEDRRLAAHPDMKPFAHADGAHEP